MEIILILMQNTSKYASWSFTLIVINLLSWFSVFASPLGIMLTQWLFFIPLFFLAPLASLVLGILGFRDIKKNKLSGYNQTLFSIIVSILSLILLFIFGTGILRMLF